MKSIEEFVDSLYRGVGGKSKEISELKEEMRLHLTETVNELKKQGKTEEEGMKIAYERFGDNTVITNGLFKLFHKQRKFIKFIFITSIVFLLIGFTSYIFMSQKDLKFENEQKILTRGVLDIVGSSNTIEENKKVKIEDMAKKYSYINYIALFNVEDIAESQEKVDEINRTNIYGNYRYPFDIKKAKVVYPNNVKPLTTRDGYDRSTVVATNGKWLVQYEYKKYIYKYIEGYSNRIVYPALFYKTPTFNYKIPAYFIIIGGTLLALWLGINLYNKLSH